MMLIALPAMVEAGALDEDVVRAFRGIAEEFGPASDGTPSAFGRRPAELATMYENGSAPDLLGATRYEAASKSMETSR